MGINIAIIPARGGSKRFPKKNIAMLGGKTLLEHAVDVAKATSFIDQIIVSTEDRDTLDIVDRIPDVRTHERSVWLGAYERKFSEVVAEVLSCIQAKSEVETYTILLPTFPFRSPTIIDYFITHCKRTKTAAYTVLSSCDFMGRMYYTYYNNVITYSTGRPETPQETGMLLYGIEDPKHLIDIDYPEDLEIAEKALVGGPFSPRIEARDAYPTYYAEPPGHLKPIYEFSSAPVSKYYTLPKNLSPYEHKRAYAKEES